MGKGTSAAVAVLLSVLVALGVLGPSAHQASAAAKPDLVVSQLSNPPSPLEPGQKFRATSTTKNAGQAKAVASTTRFYLSRDRVKGTGDVRFAAGQSVGMLGASKSARATTTLTVPAVTTPERYYYLIACADDLKKVGESRETNNCRASAERALVTENPFKTAPKFDFTPDPLAVTPTLQGTRAVTKTIPTEGGTISATASNGTKFALSLPAGALLSEQKITMTPVGQVGGLGLSGGLVGAVDLKPDGLQLHKPARLTITPPSAVPLAQQTGFSWHGTGQEYHLRALRYGKALSFELRHFSSYGVGLGTNADRAAILDNMPTRTADQYQQAASELVRKERLEQLTGQEGDPAFGDKLADLTAGYYRDVVRPKMLAAETDDALAASAIQEGLGWARQVQLLGLGDDPFFAAKMNEVWASVEKILQNAFDKSYVRCVEGDVGQAMRMLAMARMAALLGIDLGDVFEHIDSCARFELDADWTFSGEDYHTIGNGHVRVADLPLRVGVTSSGFQFGGFKDREYLSFTAEKTGRDPCMESWTTAGINTSMSQLIFQVTDLRLSYNIREELTADGRTVTRIDPPKISMEFVPGNVYEQATFKYKSDPNDTCFSDGSSATVNKFFLTNMYSTLYEGEPMFSTYYVRNWSLPSTGAWASKTYDRTGLFSEQYLFSEQTTFELRHTPAP